MGFSEKMRESLGAEGARVHVQGLEGPVARGQVTTTSVRIVGGTRPATVDALIVRLVEADRHWVRDDDGLRISEGEAQSLESRRGLTAGWMRHLVSEHRFEVGATIDPHGEHTVTIDVHVPASCQPTAPYCSHTLNVQADIKGQIDPAGNVRVTVA